MLYKKRKEIGAWVHCIQRYDMAQCADKKCCCKKWSDRFDGVADGIDVSGKKQHYKKRNESYAIKKQYKAGQ